MSEFRKDEDGGSKGEPSRKFSNCCQPHWVLYMTTLLFPGLARTFSVHRLKPSCTYILVNPVTEAFRLYICYSLI
jgi:hypothetical protein